MKCRAAFWRALLIGKSDGNLCAIGGGEVRGNHANGAACS